MVTINQFLDNVLEDFQEYIDTQNKLCCLLDVHFDAGRIPDYSDVHVQQLYLLRYAYAYAFEYKVMYQELLSRVNYENEIRVTSIGCGSFIDYWSLSRVVGPQCRIRYDGIDTIDWAYTFPRRTTDDVCFIHGNALDSFRPDTYSPSDVVIFPKSISEFSADDLRLITDEIANSNQKDTIHFLFSLRYDPGSVMRDVGKTSVIYNRMLQYGFHSPDRSDSRCSFSKAISGRKIREVDPDFCHPGNVVDCLTELYQQCRRRFACNQNSDCHSRLNRWPILSCQYAAWQIFTFER